MYSSDDWIKALCQRSQELKIISRDDKVKLLKEVREMEKDLIKEAKKMDNKKGTPKKMEGNIRKVIPSSGTSTKGNNNVLAGRIYRLFLPCGQLYSWMKECRERRVYTRSSTSSTSTAREPPREYMLLGCIVEIEKKAREVLEKRMAIETKIPEAPKLTSAQEGEFFDPSRVPQIMCFRNCLYCTHPSIDEPRENAEVESKNQTAQLQHKQRMAVWNPWNNRRSAGITNEPPPLCPIRKTPLGLKRPRSNAKYKHIFQCMCAMATCLDCGDDTSNSTCPIKCIDSSSGERYGRDDSGRCKCPICRCKCTKAVYQEVWVDTHKALEEMAKKAKNGMTTSVTNINKNIKTRNNIRNVVQEALTPVIPQRAPDQQDITTVDLTSSPLDGHNINNNDPGPVYFDLCRELSKNIARVGSEILDVGEKSGAEASAEVASGHDVNTRSIQNNKNKHAQNNRLNEHAYNMQNNNLAPGMASRLIPDTSNPSTEWIRASQTQHAPTTFTPPPENNNNNNFITPHSSSSSSSNTQLNRNLFSNNNKNNNGVSLDAKKVAYDRLQRANARRIKAGKKNKTDEEKVESERAKKRARLMKEKESDFEFALMMAAPDLDVDNPNTWNSQDYVENFDDAF